jgi:hypothetical protein
VPPLTSDPAARHAPTAEPRWRNGRRGGFKIRCLHGRGGSSPPLGIGKTRLKQRSRDSPRPHALRDRAGRFELFNGEWCPEPAKNQRVTLEDLVDHWLVEKKHKRSIRDDEQRLERAIELFGAKKRVVLLDGGTSSASGRTRDARAEARDDQPAPRRAPRSLQARGEATHHLAEPNERSAASPVPSSRSPTRPVAGSARSRRSTERSSIRSAASSGSAPRTRRRAKVGSCRSARRRSTRSRRPRKLDGFVFEMRDSATVSAQFGRESSRSMI